MKFFIYIKILFLSYFGFLLIINRWKFVSQQQKNIVLFVELLGKQYLKWWKNLPFDKKATFRPIIQWKGGLKATNAKVF